MTEIDQTILIRGRVTFTLLEIRGGIRLMQAAHESLPYGLFNMKSECLARVADRVLASWLLDCLEGAESELIRE